MRDEDRLRRVPGPQDRDKAAENGSGGECQPARFGQASSKVGSRGRSSATPRHRTPNGSTVVVGYASGRRAGRAVRRELEAQVAAIARACDRRGLRLLEVVHDREPANGKAANRPGLAYALERISTGEASGLVIDEIARVSRSAADVGTVIEWLDERNARLVAVGQEFDTSAPDGRLAANMLLEVSRWESARLSERTRNGLQAARSNGLKTGRPAVVDDPHLRDRILQMRADGMTLQAIADRLNEEGVPTVRGGSRWRHSSVQAAAGYRRPRAAAVGLYAAAPLPEETPRRAASGKPCVVR